MSIQLSAVKFEPFGTRNAREVDPSLIIEGSKDMDYPITAESIRNHEFGFFAVERGQDRPSAFGYIACKDIYLGKSPLSPEADDLLLACVGGLFLLPEYRGSGIAQRLVTKITRDIFEKEPDVQVCRANCNELSAPAFGNSGYSAGPVLADGKVPYAVTKKQWQVSS